MKRQYHTLLLLAISLVVSCQRSEVYDVAAPDPVDQHFYLPGKACIKVTEELSQRLEAGEEPAGLAEVGVLKGLSLTEADSKKGCAGPGFICGMMSNLILLLL